MLFTTLLLGGSALAVAALTHFGSKSNPRRNSTYIETHARSAPFEVYVGR